MKNAIRLFLLVGFSIGAVAITPIVREHGSSARGELTDGTKLPIPDLELWKEHMLTHGMQGCNDLLSSSRSFDHKLSHTYYDGLLVFLQIHALTSDPIWNKCIQAARSVYGDRYVLRSRGKVPGYWIFTAGLARDFVENNTSRSKRAALALARRGSFSRDDTPLRWTRNASASREVAYALEAQLDEEVLTGIVRPRRKILADQALAHLSQWFVTRRAAYVRPFMVGLTSYALIRYFERTGDERIIPALTNAADQLWQSLWVESAQAFRYTDRRLEAGDEEPAPDLNLLIAPLYGWLYFITGESRFLERGDKIFSGGVRQAFLDSGKQFNQNYRLSFRYVEWRSQKPRNKG